MILVLITFLKKDQTKFDFLDSIFDYKFYSYNQKKVLIFYLKLLTKVITLKLSEYQRIVNYY